MAADPQDAPRHAGQVVRRVLLRRNIVIDAETAHLVAAAVQAALQAGAPSRRRLRAAVLKWQRLPCSFGAGDTSINGTSAVSSARLKIHRGELTASIEEPL